MRKIIISILISIPICSVAQSINEQSFGNNVDLNDIKVNAPTSSNASGYFFRTGNHTLNAPQPSGVNYGFNIAYDANSFHQIVFGNSQNEMYFRTYAYGFGSWNRIWHSGNFTPSNYLSYINGNIGIGTTAPSYLLHVAGGQSRFEGTGNFGETYDPTIYGKGIQIVRPADQGDNAYHLSFIRAGVQVTGMGFLRNNNTFAIQMGGSNTNSDGIFLINTGNVGIGTSTPSDKLSVNGNIRSKKITVTQQNWPDYVFDSSYTLQPLSQVEQFIKDNKHLPDVPSAKEVADKGLDVGDNQAILLKKIEELTLYMIEQNKKIELLKEENEKIKKIISK
ncbi:hypothetical protein ACI6Q2_10640 [Chitinophagaceae bacterium LWZ2-11]